VLRAGASLPGAKAAVLLLHGRGAGPEDVLGLAASFWREEVAYVAPAAAGHSWYPQSFLAPLAANEPYLSSALSRVHQMLDELAVAGVPAEQVMVLGFSQGACLALEATARRPRRYGALVGLSGGRIGPPGARWPEEGSLAGTPAFLGCSDVDPHVPWERVEESAASLTRMGAEVTVRRYPGMPHTVNADEVSAASELLARLVER
jgi:predicted esterase